MRRRAADYGDHQRRAARQPLTLGRDVLPLGVRIFGAGKAEGDGFARGPPRLALKTR